MTHLVTKSLLTLWAFLSIQCHSICSEEGPPKQYSSYRPNPYCNPSHYFRSSDTQLLYRTSAIVKEAITNRLTVKAFGVRHSQTDIICTEGIPIDARGLQFFEINPDETATFGAGVSLHDATEFLRQNNRVFRTTPAYGNITIGGSIGTGAHGSSIKYTSSISSQVVGLTVVDGRGIVQNITDEADLRSFRIHLGLLGILVRITLVTQPLYKTLAHNYIISDAVLTDGRAQTWAKEVDQISLYWFPTYGQVVVANWTFVDVDTPGDASTNDHVPSTSTSFNLLAGQAGEAFSALTQSPCPAVSSLGYSSLNIVQKYTEQTLVKPTPGFVPIYHENGVFQNPAVGYNDKMFAPTCIDTLDYGPLQCPWAHGEAHANVTFLDNEISVALKDMSQFVTSVKDIITKTPCIFPFQGILLRFSAASSTYMSNAYGRESVNLEFYLIHRHKRNVDVSASLAAYQTIMQVLTKQYEGRSHWGKSGLVYQSKAMLDLKLNPTARSSFVSSMDRFDPNGVFLNDFGRRLRGSSRAQDIDPAAVHCALLDNCFRSKDSDCAAYQKCTTVQGYPSYPVCQTIGTLAPTFPTAVPIPTLNLLSWINDTLPGLQALADNALNSVLCLFDVGW